MKSHSEITDIVCVVNSVHLMQRRPLSHFIDLFSVQVKRVMDRLDQDGDGKLDFEEFQNFMKPTK